MTDNLRDRITAVLYDHWSTYGNDCECGWNCAKELSFSANYEAHVADAVIAAIDRDWIIVEPGTPLAQKILEWKWENSD